MHVIDQCEEQLNWEKWHLEGKKDDEQTKKQKEWQSCPHTGELRGENWSCVLCLSVNRGKENLLSWLAISAYYSERLNFSIVE